MIERRAEAPTMVATAVSPAPPASQALSLWRLRVSSSLNGFGLAIGPGDAPPGTGDHFVVDGAEQIGPVLGGGFAAAAGPEQDRLVAFDDIDRTGTQVDEELVHADPPDAGPSPAVDQHVQPSSQRPENTVGVSDRHQSDRGVALGNPRVPIRQAPAGAARLQQRNH